MNDLFDNFNSKTQKSYCFKNALGLKYQEEIFDSLDHVTTYLINLRLPGGTFVVQSRRKKRFGHIFDRQKKKLFAKCMEEKQQLVFIPTYKFSPDHLEIGVCD